VLGRPARGLAACALVAVAAGCGVASGSGAEGGADGKLRVVATTTQVADFARQVGGDRAEVTGVLKPNVDPHDYEPSPADLTTMNRAQVLVENGVGVEHWLAGAIDSSGYSGPVVDASRGVRLREGDGEEPAGEHSGNKHDVAGQDSEADPHIWQDPQNAKIMVADIREAFVAADPPDADVYRRNASAYLAQLDQLDADVRRQIETIPPDRRRVVTDHDSLGYYFDRYGLTFVGSVIPSFDTSAELSGHQLADLVAEIRAERVPAVFAQASLPPRTAETVASEAGVKVVAGPDALYGDTLGPQGSAGAKYLDMVRHNTTTIVTALR
jgi:ABC-type Zn uptake system ZnuABC Zn-binding protein ZnuA